MHFNRIYRNRWYFVMKCHWMYSIGTNFNDKGILNAKLFIVIKPFTSSSIIAQAWNEIIKLHQFQNIYDDEVMHRMVQEKIKFKIRIMLLLCEEKIDIFISFYFKNKNTTVFIRWTLKIVSNFQTSWTIPSF